MASASFGISTPAVSGSNLPEDPAAAKAPKNPEATTCGCGCDGCLNIQLCRCFPPVLHFFGCRREPGDLHAVNTASTAAQYDLQVLPTMSLSQFQTPQYYLCVFKMPRQMAAHQLCFCWLLPMGNTVHRKCHFHTVRRRGFHRDINFTKLCYLPIYASSGQRGSDPLCIGARLSRLLLANC